MLLQISLVLAQGFQAPIIRVARAAGQYAAPRDVLVELRDGVALPAFFGDNVNRLEFTAEARAPDAQLLVRGHSRAALALNFMRSLLASGFADVQHREYWDIRSPGSRTTPLQREYAQTAAILRNSMRFMSAIGERAISGLALADFYTSHDGYNLHYEAAQTVTV